MKPSVVSNVAGGRFGKRVLAALMVAALCTPDVWRVLIYARELAPPPPPTECTGCAHRLSPVQLAASAIILHCLDPMHDARAEARHFTVDCGKSCRSFVLGFS
jgi:hypothetical protein